MNNLWTAFLNWLADLCIEVGGWVYVRAFDAFKALPADEAEA